jgi:hypothetical protein
MAFPLGRPHRTTDPITIGGIVEYPPYLVVLLLIAILLIVVLIIAGVSID